MWKDMEYFRELAGWLATLEGGTPFTKHTTGSEVLERRIEVLENDIVCLINMGHARSDPGVRAADDLLRLLKGELPPFGFGGKTNHYSSHKYSNYVDRLVDP